jgi:hypothetical protein|tara:strand:+ start:32 stop:196 length:165 start_codon:yes stop_codon:yes gene_type:complete
MLSITGIWVKDPSVSWSESYSMLSTMAAAWNTKYLWLDAFGIKMILFSGKKTKA